MTTITAGTSLGSGLVYDSDTTGNLVIKTGSSATIAATFHGNSATVLAGNLNFNSGYGSAALAYGCRAWLRYNGTTGTIIGSGNISSVTKNATGDYTIVFTNAMPDTNYSIGGSAINAAATATAAYGCTIGPIAVSTGSVRISINRAYDNANIDVDTLSIQIFR